MAGNSSWKADQTFQDFLWLGSNNLKDYLPVRDISVWGNGKCDLVKRAFSAAKTKQSIILSSEE